MITIDNAEAHGFEAAIRGMRNPMNSWDKSDSHYVKGSDGWTDDFVVGKNDLELMQKLVKAGTDHRKFMRMINVTVDITAPLYWWKEADTYKVGTVRNSCSTMHRITAKPFELDDFSHDHLLADIGSKNWNYENVMLCMIDALNSARQLYLENKDKEYWWQIIQLLPSSYNQRSTLMLNYEVLANIYHSRKNHKLDEWRDFCKWIETLPYAKELICGGAENA